MHDMDTLQTQVCSLHGCCQTSKFRPSMTTIATTLDYDYSGSASVLVDLVSFVHKLPQHTLQCAADILSHVVSKPKRPSWDLQTSVLLACIQAIRNQSLQSGGLTLFRYGLDQLSWIRPLHAKVTPVSFRIYPKGLPGLLSTMDKQEDGTRTLMGEWVSEQTDSLWAGYAGHTLFPWLKSAANQSDLIDQTVDPSHEKVVLFLHGGGYCTMSAQTHRMLTYKISKATGRRVLAVNYRLAPETLFPGALYDAVQTYLYLTSSRIGLDPKNIVVAGDSAGGGLSLALLLYLRDHGLPLPEGAVLLSPWVDLTYGHSSWNDASYYDCLPPKPTMTDRINPALFYLGPENYAKWSTHPYASPLFAENFDHLPPLLVQSGGGEALRDEINALVTKMKASTSTKVHHEQYEDMVHVFQAFPLRQSQLALNSIGSFTKSLDAKLENEKSIETR